MCCPVFHGERLAMMLIKGAQELSFKSRTLIAVGFKVCQGKIKRRSTTRVLVNPKGNKDRLFGVATTGCYKEWLYLGSMIIMGGELSFPNLAKRFRVFLYWGRHSTSSDNWHNELSVVHLPIVQPWSLPKVLGVYWHEIHPIVLTKHIHLRWWP